MEALEQCGSRYLLPRRPRRRRALVERHHAIERSLARVGTDPLGVELAGVWGLLRVQALAFRAGGALLARTEQTATPMNRGQHIAPRIVVLAAKDLTCNTRVDCQTATLARTGWQVMVAALAPPGRRCSCRRRVAPPGLARAPEGTLGERRRRDARISQPEITAAAMPGLADDLGGGYSGTQRCARCPRRVGQSRSPPPRAAPSAPGPVAHGSSTSSQAGRGLLHGRAAQQNPAPRAGDRRGAAAPASSAAAPAMEPRSRCAAHAPAALPRRPRTVALRA